MKIFLIPQIQLNNNRIFYEFKEEKLIINFKEEKYVLDFTGLPDGELSLEDDEGNYILKNPSDIYFLLSAKKTEGTIFLELLNYVSEDATTEEFYPEWIDAKDYIKPEEVEENEEDEDSEYDGVLGEFK